MKPSVFGASVLLGAVATGGFIVVAAHPAVALGSAPQYTSSEPAKGEEVHEAPDEVEITFSEPLDQRSSARVFDECDRRIDDGDARVVLNEMTVGISDKPSGRYTVRYEATGLGGITGTTTGRFSFFVHAGPSCDGDGGGGGDHDGHGGGSGGGGGGHNGGGHGGGSGGGGGGGPHDGGHGDMHTTGGAAASHDEHAASMPGHRGGGHTPAHGRGKGHRGEHGPAHSRERHQQHGGGRPGNGGNPRLAGDDLPGGAPIDEGAIAIALGLTAALGALGGWLVRVATPA